jgi:hypothetical protein
VQVPSDLDSARTTKDSQGPLPADNGGILGPEEAADPITTQSLQVPEMRATNRPKAVRTTKAILLWGVGLSVVGLALAVGYFILLHDTQPAPQGKAQPTAKGKVGPGPAKPGAQSPGSLDTATAGQLGGWAWDRDQPDTPVKVDIFDDDALLVTLSADMFRKDLFDRKKGNGKHGFAYKVPLQKRDGKAHVIRVKISGTDVDLVNSPKTIILTRPAPAKANVGFPGPTHLIVECLAAQGAAPAGGPGGSVVQVLAAAKAARLDALALAASAKLASASFGALDSAGPTRIAGWAWNPDEPDRPVTVQLFDGDKLLASVPAKAFRADLLKNKKGNGKHAFVYQVTPPLAEGEHLIRAIISETKTELRNSPKKITISSSK